MEKSIKIIILIAVVAGLIVWGRGYNERMDRKVEEDTKREQEEIAAEYKRVMEQLIKEDVKVGTGAEAKAGNTITVHYEGAFTDGRVFDKSYGKQPFTFTLGAREVVVGWDIGIEGMKVGGIRNLTIPPELAYGPEGSGPVPPNTTLKFKVELLGVE